MGECGGRASRHEGKEEGLREALGLYQKLQGIAEAVHGLRNSHTAMAHRAIADVHSMLHEHGVNSSKTPIPSWRYIEKFIPAMGRTVPAARTCHWRACHHARTLRCTCVRQCYSRNRVAQGRTAPGRGCFCWLFSCVAADSCWKL